LLKNIKGSVKETPKVTDDFDDIPKENKFSEILTSVNQGGSLRIKGRQNTAIHSYPLNLAQERDDKKKLSKFTANKDEDIISPKENPLISIELTPPQEEKSHRFEEQFGAKEFNSLPKIVREHKKYASKSTKFNSVKDFINAQVTQKGDVSDDDKNSKFSENDDIGFIEDENWKDNKNLVSPQFRPKDNNKFNKDTNKTKKNVPNTKRDEIENFDSNLFGGIEDPGERYESKTYINKKKFHIDIIRINDHNKLEGQNNKRFSKDINTLANIDDTNQVSDKDAPDMYEFARARGKKLTYNIVTNEKLTLKNLIKNRDNKDNLVGDISNPHKYSIGDLVQKEKSGTAKNLIKVEQKNERDEVSTVIFINVFMYNSSFFTLFIIYYSLIDY